MVEGPFSATSASTVDFTEASLLAAMNELAARVSLKPTRYVVPAWVMNQIVSEYGEASEENFHRWNMKRLGLVA